MKNNLQSLENLKSSLLKLKNPQKAKLLSRFFKTGDGEYGQGDIFLGLTVPQQRQVAKNHSHLTLSDLQNLLSSKIHEYRLSALFVLMAKYKKADETEKEEIFTFYLKNTKNINNWDLIDLSAPTIVGDYLLNRDKSILFKLAKSESLWEKRIAILSTYTLIRNNNVSETLKIAEILLKDNHDLIHKAVGWMLREVGKRNQKAEENFLKKHYKIMLRTMLRYAIEKFGAEKRKFYLGK
ncbi:DNA alkylation repair protein [Candidatus Microgenomates bacterium]|nr:DNA alkylation repair protein [Candidatus Microgenomates bacterium]